jgi:Fe-S-cluster containining protein
VQLIDDADEQVPKKYVESDILGREVMKRAENGWCEALNAKTFLCEIYNLRPFLCREYEVGSFDCLNERKRLHLFESKDDSSKISE